MLRSVIWNQANERRNKEDDRVYQEGNTQAIKDAEVACKWWEEEELEQSRGYRKESKHSTDPSRVDTEATSELEGEADIRIVQFLWGMVEKDRYQLHEVSKG